MSDEPRQLPDLSGCDLQELLNKSDTEPNFGSFSPGPGDLVRYFDHPDGPIQVIWMASALPKELEDTWSERHVGNVENNDGKDCDEIAFNHKILNGSQDITDDTEMTKDERKCSDFGEEKPRRINQTRERCRVEIPLNEERLRTVCQETDTLQGIIKLKQSNLAGHRGHSYDMNLFKFSKENEKNLSAVKVQCLDKEYLEKKKTRHQQQAAYLHFLRQTYIPAKEEFLEFLKIEDKEIDIEISKSKKRNDSFM